MLACVLLLIIVLFTLSSKQQSVIQQLHARKGRLIVMCSEGDAPSVCTGDSCRVIEVPQVADCLQPVINIIPLQVQRVFFPSQFSRCYRQFFFSVWPPTFQKLSSKIAFGLVPFPSMTPWEKYSWLLHEQIKRKLNILESYKVLRNRNIFLFSNQLLAFVGSLIIRTNISPPSFCSY